eukprot:NODE_99_length_20465_cov_0.827654.p3 type:complete len:365 gc:universal NODE_99_length_20465_cov_0.827654:13085-11991(-)
MFLISLLFSISPDCPDIISLVTGLNMNIVNPSLFDQIALDCCSVNEITCSNDRIISIQLPYQGLNGTINSTAVPSSLTSLTLYNNQLYGSLSTFHPNLISIDLPHNRFNGSIAPLHDQMQFISLAFNDFYCDVPNIPKSAISFSVEANRFTGMLSPLPVNLTFLMLNFNLITGNIGKIPLNLKYFYGLANLFTGCLPNLYSPNLIIFWAQYSLMTGPVSPLHPTISELLLDDNHIHGSVKIDYPHYLGLSNTNVSDVVIVDLSQMVLCNIENTPTLGNPNIQNLTGHCDFTGIYNASDLSNAVNECPVLTTESNVSETVSNPNVPTIVTRTTATETVSTPNDQNLHPTIVTRIFKQTTLTINRE